MIMEQGMGHFSHPPFVSQKGPIKGLLQETVGILVEEFRILSLLRRLGELVGREASLGEVCQKLVEMMVEELPVHSAVLLEPSEDGSEVEVKAYADRWGDPPKRGWGPGTRHPVGGDDLIQGALSAGGIWIGQRRSKEGRDLPEHFVSLPVHWGGQRRGLILLVLSRGRDVKDRDLASLDLLSQQVSLVLEASSLLEAERTRNELLEERVRERTRDLEAANRELLLARDQLVRSEKLKALGQMASGVAHDFNNILATILGYAQLYQDRTQDPDLLQCLQTIEIAAKDGAAMVQRLQEVCGVRHVEMSWEEVDLNALLEEVRELTRPKWKDEAQKEGKTIELHLELRGGALKVKGIRSELREVFTNLIFNAVDAMPQGGEIRVTTEQRESWAEICIHDTGVGIRPEDMGRIFDPFFTTKGILHSGLGLSTSYNIIQRHGGEILVRSTPGEETRFILLLPLADSTEERPAQLPETQEDVPPSSFPRARILIIEDEQALRGILRSMLEEMGHQVEEASGGREGIERFQEGEFDLVITDLGMPGMTGWEVAEAVRRTAPEVPIIMITGWGMDLPKEVYERRGVTCLLSKPFDAKRLQKALHEVLTEKS